MPKFRNYPSFPMSARIPTILMVDDSLDDLTLMQMAFRKVGVDVPMRMLTSGEEALSYLNGRDKFADRQTYPLPTLIILDLKMPKMNGFEVLTRFSKLPLHPKPYVVVMSTSPMQEDADQAIALGAVAFHKKPAAFDDLCAIVGRIGQFFLRAPVPDQTGSAR